MPIKTKTLDQVAREFVKSYKAHLSPNNECDPRNCSKCIALFDDLIFALDGIDSSRTVLERISGGLELIEGNNIVNLFGTSGCQI